MKYYLLQDDMWSEDSADRWIFDRIKYPSLKANWEFVEPPLEYMEPCIYPVDLFRCGRDVDFSFTMDAGNVPIISDRVKRIILGIDGIDEISDIIMSPVEIQNYDIEKDYFVLIIALQEDCVDDERSSYEKFEENDPVRPDLAGQYSAFFNLVVDQNRTNGSHIFRIKNYPSAIVVSEKLKEKLELNNISGVTFSSVNGDEDVVC